MLNDNEIRAENTVVDDVAQLTLIKLVKRSEMYKEAVGYYADIATVIAAAVTAANAIGATGMAQAKAKALNAVIKKLRATPGIVVESEGGSDNRRFYSTTVNWDELAQDVLDTLYDTPAALQQAFFVVTRSLGGCACGVCPYCRRGPNDELYLTTQGSYRRTAGEYC